ncbi:DUF4339 domain-containing protein [Bradyrhizobium daqingense]|uniref:Uncharacterized protein DUF4339 n=1 Tax=Bradyrhizobium daqingense TaxID=993502 RepID=A0A562LJ24_9BRAD|nr:DUF4339 domain-containing protein [Bradyrhizobium daqingense]TWI07603.1 uncharacterized protein DUF4339 [Bradyrhizobium daqingense]UFS90068.1 DUF4339 domain-containing protein [Bradyrhizobium daqingense]
MANRIWFYASEGQQKGPFPETQFRDLIAQGTVIADTLVWAEGMAGWQKAGEVPGLISGGPAPQSLLSDGSGYSGGPLSVDLPLWSFLGWCILLVIGNLLVIPAPWTATGYYRWLFPRIHVPQRPNITFTGQAGDIWYVFVGMGLTGYAGFIDDIFQLATIPLQAALSWMIVRWVIANLSSNGQPIPMAFNGSVWAFISWQLLMFVSMFTIIGWAWVMAAWMRWICRNIGGTRREMIFVGTGLQLLWRTVAFGLGCLLIIPIPWLLRWYFAWTTSQFGLVERSAAGRA